MLATIGSKAELKSTLSYALEISGRDWAACLDKRQVRGFSLLILRFCAGNLEFEE